MKKSLFTIILVFTAFVAMAQTGSAGISPSVIYIGTYHPIINITYKPDAATAFSGGAIEIIVPQGFTPSPNTSTNLSAVIMAANVTISAVNAANIIVSGNAVTISALNLSSDQQLVVTYGVSGSGGIYPPSAPGKYVFNMAEQISSTASFTAIDPSPIIYVTNLSLEKTSNASIIMAGNTVTYFLNYKNNDSVNQVTSLSVWDTLPYGMSYKSSVPSPTYVSGNFIRWDISSLSASTASGITLYATANTGIINYGTTNINYASASAINPVSGTNVMETKIAIPVQGVILTTTFSVFPSSVQLDQNITLVMGITNSGNMDATMVSGTAQAVSSGGDAIPYIYPYPAYVSSLAQGQTSSFTWVFKSTAAGLVRFSGYALGRENSMNVSSINAGTNYVTITNPTFTPTKTDTPLPPTDTPVMTDTQVVPAGTSTDTPGITVDSPTATPTDVNTQTTPATTATPIPLVKDKVLTDKNYIDLSRGDKVTIRYKVESRGMTYIKIMNLSGDVVKTLYNSNLDPGTYTAYWDGTNNSGIKAGKGMYFIAVTQPGGHTIKKIMVIK
jgi:uncharacterized repeat protein (TIGR01451 family)